MSRPTTPPLPSPDETNLITLLAHRDQHLSHEAALAHSSSFRSRLSPTAVKADAIFTAIRNHEHRTIWASPDDADTFPGMMFTLAKARMERTLLWRIVKKMPKGALLHAHLEAMVDPAWVFERGLEVEGMCVVLSGEGGITTQEDANSRAVRFTFVPEVEAHNHSDIGPWDSDHSAGRPYPMKTAAESFPSSLTGLGGTEGFLAWLVEKSTITPDESLAHHEGITKVWDKFQSVFGVLGGIIYYAPILRKFLLHLFEALKEDGISWVDVRAAFHMSLQEESTGRVLPTTDVVRIFGEAVEEFKSSAQGRGWWGARLIWTSVRSFPADLIRDNMALCLKAKQQYPHLLAGYDLVGFEDAGRSLLSHLPDLLWFRGECQKAGVDIPFYLHAGETLNSGPDTADDNLLTAMLLRCRRLGHAFSLYRHPHLMSLARKNGIVLEICPISNEVLRLASSILAHPLPAYMNHGLAVAVSNDDPGVLGQTVSGSLSHDLWQVGAAYGGVGLAGLGDLVETGVGAAAYGEGVEGGKLGKERTEQWRGEWEEFCGWVVGEFGEWEGRE